MGKNKKKVSGRLKVDSQKIKRAKRPKVPVASATASGEQWRAPEIVLRTDVEAAYVHPGVLVAAHEVPHTKVLALEALVKGYKVRSIVGAGTSHPVWIATLPASGGPPVEACQYRGEPVTWQAVFAKSATLGSFRASWNNGRIGNVQVRPVGGLWSVIGVTALTAQVKAGGILVPLPRKVD